MIHLVVCVFGEPVIGTLEMLHPYLWSKVNTEHSLHILVCSQRYVRSEGSDEVLLYKGLKSPP